MANRVLPAPRREGSFPVVSINSLLIQRIGPLLTLNKPNKPNKLKELNQRNKPNELNKLDKQNKPEKPDKPE